MHLELSYESTTVEKKTSGVSFFSLKSPKAESGWGRYDWLKLGIIPVGPKLSNLYQNKHNFLHSWNFDAMLVPLESLLPGLQFGHKNDLKRSSLEGVMPD